MAKQKAGMPVRVRSTENASGEVRARALKMGSSSVATRSVGPDMVESVATFPKRKDAIEFKTWLQKRRAGDAEIIAE